MQPQRLEKMTPLYILWLLRDRQANDWVSLAHTFGLGADQVGTAEGMLLHYLYALREANLITFDGDVSDRWSPVKGRIEITEGWTRIQAALQVSLTELSRLRRGSLIVEPLFAPARSGSKANDLFVLMPFISGMRAIFDDHITHVAQELELSVRRGDDFFTAQSVIDDIWMAILEAKAVIADCTGRNPNVFYEMGLAHTVGRPVILMTQSADDVPFDVGHLRYIHYEYTPRGMKLFEQKLADTLRAELGLTTTRDVPL